MTRECARGESGSRGTASRTPRPRACVGAARPLLLAFGLLLLSGCAYFNTFYYARKYYGQAEKMVQDSRSDKVPPQAAERYDKAIEQCAKVIQRHEGSRWVDDAIYLMGASYYGKREFDRALGKFDELLLNFPTSKLVSDAWFMIGLCHYELRNYEEMNAAFRRTLELKSNFKKRDEILFTRAKAAEAMRERDEAVRRYRELVDEFSGSPRAEEGLLRIGDLYFDAGSVDSAYASYVELARTARTDKTYQEAQLKAAESLIRLDRSEEASKRLRDLIPDDSNQPGQDMEFLARARISLARAQNSLGQHEEALTTLREVTEGQGASNYAAEAQFQIGYTYEVYLDSLEVARAAYDQVSKIGSRSVFREQAATRARNLQQLQALSTQVASDSTSGVDRQAEAVLKIAELYLFSQNKRDEALEKYREVTKDYPDSRVAPRAAYAVGWIHLYEIEGGREEGLAEIESVIQRYPSSRAARGALDLLAREGADTTGLAALLLEPEPDTVAVDTTAVEPGVTPLSTPPGFVSPVPRDSGLGPLSGPGSDSLAVYASPVSPLGASGGTLRGDSLGLEPGAGGNGPPPPMGEWAGVGTDSLAAPDSSRGAMIPPPPDTSEAETDSVAPPPDSLGEDASGGPPQRERSR